MEPKLLEPRFCFDPLAGALLMGSARNLGLKRYSVIRYI
jgi:hypothetical protein